MHTHVYMQTIYTKHFTNKNNRTSHLREKYQTGMIVPCRDTQLTTPYFIDFVTPFVFIFAENM